MFVFLQIETKNERWLGSVWMLVNFVHGIQMEDNVGKIQDIYEHLFMFLSSSYNCVGSSCADNYILFFFEKRTI